MFAFENFQQVSITGRLGKDPVLAYIGKNNIAVCRFSVAVNRQEQVEGQWHKATEWFQVVAWHKDAELAAKHLKKASLVQIIGTNKTSQYTDKRTGEVKSSIELVAGIMIGLTNTKPSEVAASQSQSGVEEGATQLDAETEPDWFTDEAADNQADVLD